MNIRLVDVHKQYSLPGKGHLNILKGCDLEVPSQQRVGIIGPSGVGKSTLLHILGLLDSPTQGDIYIDDKRMNDISSDLLAHYRNQKIGFVFQHHYLLNECSVLENVLMPALIMGRSLKEAKEESSALLRHVGLDNRKTFYPAQLSGGERQRVALARALMNKPSLILADEITGSLDPSLKADMMKLLVKCCKRFKATLIAVTHDFSMIEYYDTVYKLYEGRLSCYTTEG